MVSAACSFLVFCALLACCFSYSVALFEDQAGQLDWHVTLVGTPLSASFYRGSNEPTILVGTERNVLASLDLTSGDAVWRQVLSTGEKLHTKVHRENQLVSVSTATISMRNAEHGGLLWEYELPAPSPSIGDAAFTSAGDVAAFHQAGIVLLDGKSGTPKWETPTDLAKFSKIHIPARKDQIYLFGLSDEKFINIVSFDFAQGKESQRYTLNSAPQKDSVIFAGGLLAWLEDGNIVAHTLGNKNTMFKTDIKNVVGTSDYPHQLSQVDSAVNAFILRAGSTAAIVRLRENREAARVHMFPKLVGSATFAGSHNSEGTFSISMVTKTVHDKALVQIIDLAAVVVKTEYEVDFDVKKTGSFEKSFIGPNHEILLVTADATVCLLTSHNSKPSWSREEGLADLISAEYVDLPEDERPEETEQTSSIGRYLRRLETHAEHAKNALLDFQSVVEFVPSFLGGNSLSDSFSKETNLFRDTFGYRKLIIVGSRTGKIFALDSKNNGQIVWMTYFGPSFRPSEIHSLRTAVVKYPPVVVVIGKTDAAETVIWRINALTGEEFLGDSKQDNIPARTVLNFSALKIFKLPIEEQVERMHVLGLLKQPSAFTTYPETQETKQAFQPFAKKLFYALGNIGDTRVSGYSVDSKTMETEENWHLQFPEGENIVAYAKRPSHDKVASLGRVLGDRSVLYKYLNPNMQTYVTYNNATWTLKIYTVDITKGAVLHSGVHRSAGKQAVHVIQCENWVVYHYWNEGEGGSNEKGYVVVVSEFFESDMPDVRHSGDKFTSFSSQKPFVQTRSFSFPYGVTAVGVSTTRLGISTREILFATQKGQIYGVPRRMLDARRPNPPLTADQKEEMLVPYEPSIPENPKSIVTYHLEVLGTRSIITTPALLESTSLVFAFGLDLFHTRVSPSKQFDVLSEDFSKIGLLATMAACLIGILVAGPLVRRKNTNASWQ